MVDRPVNFIGIAQRPKSERDLSSVEGRQPAKVLALPVAQIQAPPLPDASDHLLRAMMEEFGAENFRIEVAGIDERLVEGDVASVIKAKGGTLAGRCVKAEYKPSSDIAGVPSNWEIGARYRMFDGFQAKRNQILCGDGSFLAAFAQLHEPFVMISAVLGLNARGVSPLWTFPKNYVPPAWLKLQPLTAHCNPLIAELLRRGHVYELDQSVMPEYHRHLRRYLHAGGILLQFPGAYMPLPFGPHLAGELAALLR
jgi:hypothetical protein